LLGGKGGRCVGLTTLPSSCADCLEIWKPQTPGNLRACTGIPLPFYECPTKNLHSNNVHNWCRQWTRGMNLLSVLAVRRPLLQPDLAPYRTELSSGLYNNIGSVGNKSEVWSTVDNYNNDILACHLSATALALGHLNTLHNVKFNLCKIHVIYVLRCSRKSFTIGIFLHILRLSIDNVHKPDDRWESSGEPSASSRPL